MKPRTFRIKLDDYKELVGMLRTAFKLTSTEIEQIVRMSHALSETDGEITPEVRERWSQAVNLPPQSVRNKLTTFRKKGVIINNKLHPLLMNKVVTVEIVYEPQRVNQENSEETEPTDKSS